MISRAHKQTVVPEISCAGWTVYFNRIQGQAKVPTSYTEFILGAVVQLLTGIPINVYLNL